MVRSTLGAIPVSGDIPIKIPRYTDDKTVDNRSGTLLFVVCCCVCFAGRDARASPTAVVVLLLCVIAFALLCHGGVCTPSLVPPPCTFVVLRHVDYTRHSLCQMPDTSRRACSLACHNDEDTGIVNDDNNGITINDNYKETSTNDNYKQRTTINEQQQYFTLNRRSRQSEAATFFNSLDENADGVLAENEIREV